MSMQSINVVLERQLLMQLGDRIRRLRKARGIGTVEMAKRAGITRNTLRAVESGDPGTAIGIYLHVMSILGVGSEFALLASDSVSPPPTDSASARTKRPMPVVRVHVSADEARHRVQDLQSLAMHEEAVRLVKANPWLIEKAQETTNRWLATDDPYSAELWREWQNILKAGSWRRALGRTRHAQQLRQASPLVTILPEEVRQQVIAQVKKLKQGVMFGAPGDNPSEEEHEARRP